MKKKRKAQLKRIFYIALPIFVIVMLFSFPFSPGRIKLLNSVEDESRSNISKITNTDLKSIEDLQNQYSKAVIYFTSTWCGTCKSSIDALSTIAQDYPSLDFLIMDIEAFRTIANEAEVSLPNALVFVDDVTFKTDTVIQLDILKARINIFIDVGAFAL